MKQASLLLAFLVAGCADSSSSAVNDAARAPAVVESYDPTTEREALPEVNASSVTDATTASIDEANAEITSRADEAATTKTDADSGIGFLARVVAVTDGDTIKILDAKKNQLTIRLNGIDTPERKQAYGSRAGEALSTLVFGKEVRCVALNTDRYGRTIGDIYIGKSLVNLQLVKDGWAWHYKQYSDDESLAAAEVEARTEKRGLWGDTQEPIPPWEFRQREREKSGGGD